MPEEKEIKKDRMFEIQTDLKHIKMRMDQIYGMIYKIKDEGLKVKVVK